MANGTLHTIFLSFLTSYVNGFFIHVAAEYFGFYSGMGIIFASFLLILVVFDNEPIMVDMILPGIQRLLRRIPVYRDVTLRIARTPICPGELGLLFPQETYPPGNPCFRITYLSTNLFPIHL